MSRQCQSEIIDVEPSSVRWDQRVNPRPVDPTWVRSKLQVGFDPEKLGVLTVSLRDDGSLVWLDGQRRGALAEAAGRAQLAVPMQVFQELSLAEEAEIFLGLNDSRAVTPLYTFLAELTIEKREAVEINRIARRCGWRVSDKGVRSLRSVTALRKIYRADETGAALEATLRVSAEAWGYDKASAKSAMLLGVASVVVESGFDRDSLVKKLRADSRGPEGLLATAAGFRQLGGGTVDRAVDQVLRGIYNTGRKRGRLSVWEPSVGSPRSRKPARALVSA
ncbi:hypothetical protein [Streptomyces microflavus]|uniref:hypothetical protein n=1 Tax=Streptomyces microflavus TaxID=1919 RepID=UPI0033A9997A